MTIGITGPERKVPRQSAVVGLIIAAAVFGVICLTLLSLASDFLVDWLWFSSIGYLQVFLTTIGAKAIVFFAVLAATTVVLWLNGVLAARFAVQPPLQIAAAPWKVASVTPPPDPFVILRDRLTRPRFIALGAGLLAVLVAAGRSRQLEYLPAVSLPRALRRRRSALQQGHRLLSLFAARLYRDQELDAARNRPERAVRRSDLLGARRHRIQCSQPINLADDDRTWLGAAGSSVRGEGLVLWSRPLSAALRRQRRRGRGKLHRCPCGAAGPVAADRAFDHRGVRRMGQPAGCAPTGFLPPRSSSSAPARSCCPSLVPALFRHFVVKPSELQLEKPYIERNIALTRQAYNLDQIAAKPFAAEQRLTFKTLEANKATIDNIRLWDWQPLIGHLRAAAGDPHLLQIPSMLTSIAIGSTAPTRA